MSGFLDPGEVEIDEVHFGSTKGPSIMVEVIPDCRVWIVENSKGFCSTGTMPGTIELE